MCFIILAYLLLNIISLISFPSWRNIPASFPFSEFCMILEYGGPNKSSALLSLVPKLDGLPPLHFLYVTVDGEDFPVALVEDNHTDKDPKSTLVSITLLRLNWFNLYIHSDPGVHNLKLFSEKVHMHFNMKCGSSFITCRYICYPFKLIFLIKFICYI